MDYISLTISFIALALSGLAFWLTRIRKGTLKMTRPTVIFFGPDGPGKGDKKVFIRTLLYSTSDQGKYIQNMFVRLKKDDSEQDFNIWVYDNDGLVRGSGLFVNKSGISSNHHFLMPKDSLKYDFSAGDYDLTIYAETVGDKPRKLFQQHLILTSVQEQQMNTEKAGLYFDWAPNKQNYHSHVDSGPKERKELTELIGKLTEKV